MKIIDKINLAEQENRPFYSFEYFPPKTENGIYNLYERFERMLALEPSFIDITWGAGGSTADRSLEISRNAQQYFGCDVMMHLTCTNTTQDKILSTLNEVREAGIENILALRGDPMDGQDNWEKSDDSLCYGSDLTRLIREKFGDSFCIGVGGYPEGHGESDSLLECVRHLKNKVDLGADFIITQLFYDLDAFKRFHDLCRSEGIVCPIVPGLLPIHNYERFKRFTDFLKIEIPDPISQKLEALKNNDSDIIDYGIDLGIEMCEELRKFGCPGVHFYTLNLETSVTKILQGLGWADECRQRRSLPWRKSTTQTRENESVRPIFWSNRPKSYMSRTREWDDFPNGRWGDSSSPSFGALDQYYLIGRALKNKDYRRKCLEQWGEPKSVEDVAKVFVQFCKGEINRLPWGEMPVQAETALIDEKLVDLNQKNYFTINSQPQINGLPSDDPIVGWGGEGGYIYQKAYLEFFVSELELGRLLENMKSKPSITFQAVNRHGVTHSNTGESVTAVTWGVFPGKEIIQPTVVDIESFKIWKEEAFALWKTAWMDLYSKDSKSYQVLDSIMNEYFLVNVVENDYINGNIFSIF